MMMMMRTSSPPPIYIFVPPCRHATGWGKSRTLHARGVRFQRSDTFARQLRVQISCEATVLPSEFRTLHLKLRDKRKVVRGALRIRRAHDVAGHNALREVHRSERGCRCVGWTLSEKATVPNHYLGPNCQESEASNLAWPRAPRSRRASAGEGQGPHQLLGFGLNVRC
jgi:hypothetical protein